MCMGKSDTPEAAAARAKLIADNKANFNADGTFNAAKANANPNTLADTNALYRGNMSPEEQATYDASQPLTPVAPAPDLADKLLRKAGATSLLSQASKQGRKSSFLSGAMGDVTAPLLTKKSTLGGY